MESAENVDQLSCQVACSRVLQREVACLHLGDCVKRHLHGHPRGEVNAHVRSGSVNSHLNVAACTWERGNGGESLIPLLLVSEGSFGVCCGVGEPLERLMSSFLHL